MEQAIEAGKYKAKVQEAYVELNIQENNSPD